MRVVITRPAGDAQTWLDTLKHAGYPTLALPLIDVEPATHKLPIVHAWARWPEWQAVMFVSAPAVRHFFACQPEILPSEAVMDGRLAWANGPRCWATGPGTHKALIQAGVPESCIDSPSPDATQFDSEALWLHVSGQVEAGTSVLIVRGRDVTTMPETQSASSSQDNTRQGTGRDWLAQQLQAVGAIPHFVVAYERHAPVWTTSQESQARQAAVDGSVWCFSSSQAIAHLDHILPGQNWHQARCLATHDRIARTAQALGFGAVHTSRPSLGDVLRSLESLA